MSDIFIKETSFEDKIFRRLQSFGKSYGIQTVGKKEYIYNAAWYAYAHWVLMYRDGHCDRDMFVRVIGIDGLTYLFDESDLIKSELVKTETAIPQDIKDDVNDAARKHDAVALIHKYFPVGKDSASGD